MTILATRPDLGAPKIWTSPSLARWELENGMSGRHVRLDHSRVLHLAVWFPASLATEDPNKEGVTNLMAQLLFEGTEWKSSAAFAGELDRIAADMGAEARADGVAVHLAVPMSRAERGIQLLAEALRAPAWSDTDFERLKAMRVADIAMDFAQPQTRAQIAFAGAIYDESTRASRPSGGTESTVTAITREDVIARYSEVIVPSQAIVVSVGACEPEEVRALVAEHLGDWTVISRLDAPLSPRVFSSPQNVFVSRPGASQTQILIGSSTATRSDAAWGDAMLASYVLGEGLMSRLNHELREIKAYTYGARSGFDADRTNGLFTVSFSVDADVTASALTDALRILREFRDGGFTETEHASAQEAVISRAPIRLESSGDILATNLIGVSTVLKDTWYSDMLVAIAESSARSASESYRGIVPESLTVVLVGDPDVCLPQLQSAGIAVHEEQ